MINSGEIFQYVGASIENALNGFVTTTSSRACGMLIPIMSTAMALWVVCFGWSVIRGEAGEPVQLFAFKAVKLSLVLSFSLGAGLYQGNVVAITNGLSDTLAAASFDPGTTNVYQAIDRLDDEGQSRGGIAANRWIHRHSRGNSHDSCHRRRVASGRKLRTSCKGRARLSARFRSDLYR